ncbi:MAG TPA: UdgX family uracil-DNA binding protein [Burkholderiales bacterium]|nr:UdgX family uracil-DNA binding protein [Burkholderiales bacterium]
MPTRRNTATRADAPAAQFPAFGDEQLRDEGRAQTAPAEEARIAAPASARGSLDNLREAAMRCRACPLWRHATQTVFGEGASHAPLLVVGEQPGNSEDLAGHPFVGPAGRLLEQAMSASGVDRDQVYLTNAVKHFKWELRGKRRLHKTPAQKEIDACLPWLQAEIELVKPKVVLCLGATAARATLGGPVRINEHRGQSIRTPNGYEVVVTMHPAYVLRLKAGAAEEAYNMMRSDIALAARIATG